MCALTTDVIQLDWTVEPIIHKDLRKIEWGVALVYYKHDGSELDWSKGNLR